ncbi:hypothetical protein DPMN_092349 [Dreissena polymorpha]|uniref:Uncharacterized protein n=1 Tax=Dreissena polymorpha TaxID=45954 RepID=A0A9D4R1L0_DREPO|nr:hypothetical protein DPMN_092349 [Dreissena polymorpha]
MFAGKLTRQVEYLKEELGSEVTAKDKCRDEIRELQRALEQSTETRVCSQCFFTILGMEWSPF